MSVVSGVSASESLLIDCIGEVSVPSVENGSCGDTEEEAPVVLVNGWKGEDVMVKNQL